MDIRKLGEAALHELGTGIKEGGITNLVTVADEVERIVDSEVLKKTGRRWAQEQIEATQSLVVTPVGQLTLTDVNFDLLPNQTIFEAGESPSHWTHVGKEWARGIRDNVLLCGFAFNRRMNHASALGWAHSQTNRRLRGSGACIRRAHLQVVPYYDGGGESHYPDEGFSLWRHAFGKPGACFPSAWHDAGRAGKFSMDWVERMMGAGHRWWFIDENQSTPLR